MHKNKKELLMKHQQFSFDLFSLLVTVSATAFN